MSGNFVRNRDNNAVLWLGDIAPEMTEDFITESFRLLNVNITYVKIIRDRDSGAPAGYAFVGFDSEETTKHVLETYNGTPIPNSGNGQKFKMNTAGKNSHFHHQGGHHHHFNKQGGGGNYRNHRYSGGGFSPPNAAQFGDPNNIPHPPRNHRHSSYHHSNITNSGYQDAPPPPPPVQNSGSAFNGPSPPMSGGGLSTGSPAPNSSNNSGSGASSSSTPSVTGRHSVSSVTNSLNQVTLTSPGNQITHHHSITPPENAALSAANHVHEYTAFVGSLDFQITDEVLYEKFKSKYPSVNYGKVILESTTGQSKGFGFVRFTSQAEYKAALMECNDQPIFGGKRGIRISKAHPRPPPAHHSHHHHLNHHLGGSLFVHPGNTFGGNFGQFAANQQQSSANAYPMFAPNGANNHPGGNFGGKQLNNRPPGNIAQGGKGGAGGNLGDRRGGNNQGDDSSFDSRQKKAKQEQFLAYIRSNAQNLPSQNNPIGNQMLPPGPPNQPGNLAGDPSNVLGQPIVMSDASGYPFVMYPGGYSASLGGYPAPGDAAASLAAGHQIAASGAPGQLPPMAAYYPSPTGYSWPSGVDAMQLYAAYGGAEYVQAASSAAGGAPNGPAATPIPMIPYNQETAPMFHGGLVDMRSFPGQMLPPGVQYHAPPSAAAGAPRGNSFGGGDNMIAPGGPTPPADMSEVAATNGWGQ